MDPQTQLTALILMQVGVITAAMIVGFGIGYLWRKEQEYFYQKNNYKSRIPWDS